MTKISIRFVDLDRAKKGDWVLQQRYGDKNRRGYQPLAARKVVRATKCRIYLSSDEFYSRDGDGKSAYHNGYLCFATPSRVEEWKRQMIDEENRQAEQRSRYKKRENALRERLRAWAIDAIERIDLTDDQNDKIDVLLEQAEVFFNLRQEL